MWAVQKASPAQMKARITKSHHLRVRSLGLLYCNETHSLTTPFVVYSDPDPEKVVTDVVGWGVAPAISHPPAG
jgi:hypothetical protein